MVEKNFLPALCPKDAYWAKLSTEQLRRLYTQSSRREKAEILDWVCSTRNFHRKHAIRWLSANWIDATEEKRKVRSRRRATVEESVRLAWHSSGRIASRRLSEVMPLWVQALANKVDLDSCVHSRLKRISPASIVRILRKSRNVADEAAEGAESLNIRSEIMSKLWRINRPGFIFIEIRAIERRADTYLVELYDRYSGWCDSMTVIATGKGDFSLCLEVLRNNFPAAIFAVYIKSCADSALTAARNLFLDKVSAVPVSFEKTDARPVSSKIARRASGLNRLSQFYRPSGARAAAIHPAALSALKQGVANLDRPQVEDSEDGNSVMNYKA